MRLWHTALIPVLDNLRICDQHQTCCNLRGLGWNKRNPLVNFVFDSPLGEEGLYVYHRKVLDEGKSRGINFDEQWFDPHYCGKRRELREVNDILELRARQFPYVYLEMDRQYLMDDLDRLKQKGVDASYSNLPNTPFISIHVKDSKANILRSVPVHVHDIL